MLNSTRCFGEFQGALKAQDIVKVARERDFESRKARKLGSVPWFWTLILGSGTGRKRSLARLSRLAGEMTLRRISRQGFHQRFGPEAVAFMRGMWEHLNTVTSFQTKESLPGNLAAFRDVHAFDSTTLGLVARLAKVFPACRTNVREAGLKVHTRMSLCRGQAEAVQITPERVHDRRGMLLDEREDLADLLLLFDLGYFDYALFGAIIRAKGDFISRLKESANGTILNVRRGCARRHVGEALNQAIYKGPAVDLDVEFGGNSKAFLVRVVGIRNRETGEYHWYLTTLDSDAFSPEEIAEIYRLRWQIELLFKN